MTAFKRLYERYKELIKYVFFGALTTLVSLVSFKLSDILLGARLYLVSNVISWIAAVSFAYVTNKLWVFESREWKGKTVLRELISFFTARLFSLGVEELGLWVLISLLHFSRVSFTIWRWSIDGNLLSKFIMQFVVLVLNYVFSKFIIFAKRDKKTDNN